MTAYHIWEKHEELLKKFSLEEKNIFEQMGYFISSIGEVSEEALKQYIENQGK